VFGLGAGLLYLRLRMHPSLRHVVWYSLAVFVIVLSFFTNPLGLLNIVVNVVIMSVIVVIVAPGNDRQARKVSLP
jgi:hypothetical protein